MRIPLLSSKDFAGHVGHMNYRTGWTTWAVSQYASDPSLDGCVGGGLTTSIYHPVPVGGPVSTGSSAGTSTGLLAVSSDGTVMTESLQLCHRLCPNSSRTAQVAWPRPLPGRSLLEAGSDWPESASLPGLFSLNAASTPSANHRPARDVYTDTYKTSCQCSSKTKPSSQKTASASHPGPGSCWEMVAGIQVLPPSTARTAPCSQLKAF